MSNNDFESKKNSPSKQTPDGVKGESGVGYKNPPKASQFKKGQSGNPSGKRAEDLFAAQDLGAFEAEIARQLQDVHHLRDEKGRTVKQTGAAILARSVWASAVKEDGPSRRYLLSKLNINLANLDRETDEAVLSARKLNAIGRMLLDPMNADWDEFDRQYAKAEKSRKGKSARKRRKEDPDPDAELDPKSED